MSRTAPVIYVGTAGWNIPRAQRERFPVEGSGLARYATRLNAAEINTSFYRFHAPKVYERWAAAVPRQFRFALKVPKIVTHERGLLRVREPLARFLDDSAALGRARGPLLVQLPPSHAFDARRAGRFFELFRRLHAGSIVCEPRHATWATAAADRLLERFEIARVAADPPRADGLGQPGGSHQLVYYRWHGAPRPYFSSYPAEALDRLAAALKATRTDAWCIFDNTGSGAAAANALDLRSRL